MRRRGTTKAPARQAAQGQAGATPVPITKAKTVLASTKQAAAEGTAATLDPGATLSELRAEAKGAAVSPDGSPAGGDAAAAEPADSTSVAAVIVFGKEHNALPQGSWFTAKEEVLARKAAGLLGLHVVAVETDEHRQLAKELRAGQVYAAERLFAPVIRQDLFDHLAKATSNMAAVVKPVHPPAASLDQIELGSLVLACDGDDEGWWEAIVVGLIDTDRLQLRWRYTPKDAAFERPRAEIAFLPQQVSAAA